MSDTFIAVPFTVTVWVLAPGSDPTSARDWLQHQLDHEMRRRDGTLVEYDFHQEVRPMPIAQEPTPCLCGVPGCVSLSGRRFAQGHDQRYLGQCLDRISAGDPTGADDMEQYIPGHARHYDMACLRANIGQKREELPRLCRPR